MPSPKRVFDVEIDIPDLSGKVVVVTGGNAGIGKVVCKFLVKHNPSRIYIVARNLKTAEFTIAEIKGLAPKVEVTFVECNLASFSSVEKAARIIISTTTRLDLLFCNAGILGAGEGAPPGLTEDGYEIQFGVNHLGHALLVKLLLPTLLKTAELHPTVRVITNTSSGYRFHASQGIVFKDLRTRQENLTFMGGFGGWLRYFQSKLANVVYNNELARRYPSIKFVAIHPGVVDTPLTPKYIRSNALGRQLLAEGGLKTPEEGSWNQLWAATSKDVVSGQYYEPVGILGKRTSKSKDEKLRDELWDWTAIQLKDYTI